MSDLVSKAKEGRGSLEKIAAAIPGFSGYMERATRRDADRLLRQTVAAGFEQQWSRVSEIQRQLAASKLIELVGSLEAAALKLRILTDRIRTASYGYAGFFDIIKINEAQLAQLYQFDNSLLDLVKQVTAAVDNVESSVGSDGLPAAIRNLTGLAQTGVDTFAGRSEVLTSAGQ
ncbi:MAG: hypothetical protein ABSG98_04950 [Anaerolineales bacterium]|jgi:hypothetical protein